MGKGRTGVHIHLDNTILDGSLDLFLRGTRATVENEEPEQRGLQNLVIGGNHTHRGLGDALSSFSLTCF